MKAIQTIIIAVGLIMITSTSYSAGNESGNSFSKAKKILLKNIYDNHNVTFYAGCTYSGKKIDLKSCGMTPRKQQKRASRLEWEHIMPAWEFGHQLLCWKKKKYINKKGKEKTMGARTNCIKNNTEFNRMESDMHNLRPAVGEINGDRSNFKFSMISGEDRVYGDVDFEISFKDRVVEPADSIRGDIARTYFYMAETYRVRLSRKQFQLYKAWHKLDPVDKWERERNCKIYKIQGNYNRFIGQCK